MELTYRIVDTPGWGYGYVVESADGTFSVTQDYKPGVAGFVRMNQAEAQAFAQQLIDQKLAEQPAA